MKIVFALVLLAVAAFCVFGYLASGEITDSAARLPWQLGYGGIGLTCAVGALYLLFARANKTQESD